MKGPEVVFVLGGVLACLVAVLPLLVNAAIDRFSERKEGPK